MSTTLLSHKANHRPASAAAGSGSTTGPTSSQRPAFQQQQRSSSSSSSSTPSSGTAQASGGGRDQGRTGTSLNMLAVVAITALIASALPSAYAAEPIIAPSTTVRSTASVAASTTAAPAAGNATTGTGNATTPAPLTVTRSYSVSGNVTYTFNVTPSLAPSTTIFTPTTLPTVSAVTAGPLAGTEAAPVPQAGNAFGPDDSYVTGGTSRRLVPTGGTMALLSVAISTTITFILGTRLLP